MHILWMNEISNDWMNESLYSKSQGSLEVNNIKFEIKIFYK